MKKRAILSRISKNLKEFHPEYDNHFMCPTCLKVIETTKSHDISEAHIVPKFAGGKLKTYLCIKCNSTFGSKQDKWLGEWLEVRSSGKSVFNANKQAGYFELNGVRVSGKHRETDSGIDLMIFQDRTSPAALEKINNLGSSITLNMNIPLAKNEHLINIGFLTAAYLLWFKELGYSWVLQGHLDVVREQILNPDDNIINSGYIAFLDDYTFEKPYVGVLKQGDGFSLVTCIYNAVIFLPPFGKHDFYTELPLRSVEFTTDDLQLMKFTEAHKFAGPIGVLYEDKLAVFSDKLKSGEIKQNILYFPGKDQKPQYMRSVSDSEYEDLCKNENVKHVKISGT